MIPMTMTRILAVDVGAAGPLSTRTDAGVGVGVATAPGNGMSPAVADMDRQRTSREMAISFFMG